MVARWGLFAEKRMRVPLQVIAASGAIGLLFLVVGLLSWQVYRGAQDALISASNDAVGYIREAISEKVRRTVEPAEEQLNFLAFNPISQADTLPSRLQQLPLIADALARNQLLDALYIGYPSGEFILFRPLRSAADRQRFNAPDTASLLVQSITRDSGGQMIGEYHLYDDKNALLRSTIQADYKFDPRQRTWFKDASRQDSNILTEPYVFFTTEAIGVTMARRSVSGGAVIGTDVKLSSIAAELSQLRITPSTEIALIDQQGRIVAYRDMLKMIVRPAGGNIRLANIDELNIAPLRRAAALALSGSTQTRETVAAYGRHWQIIQSKIDVEDTRHLSLLIAIPNDEFFAAARRIVWRQAVVVGLLMLLSIPITWLVTQQLVRPLRKLARETAKIENFDFTSDTHVRSRIAEIDDLGRALHRMKQTIRKFLKIGTALAAERDFKSLLDRVLQETIALVRSDGGAIFMINEERRQLIPEATYWHGHEIAEISTAPQPISLDSPGVLQYLATATSQKEIQTIDHHLTDEELAMLGLQKLAVESNATHLGLIIVPLLGRNQAPLGTLLLAKTIAPENKQWMVDGKLLKLVRAVSGSASVAIQNKQLLDAQRNLIDALIRLVAGAIDAKSPYTGGHCQRVPVLTRMLAAAACIQESGPYKDFNLSDEEWEALNIASWLHDCGKVTTPEYVVDKATKLETIHDRIHEIRNRFEVLKRDAEIAYWRGIAEGGDPEQLRDIMTAAKRELDEDFAVVAACNEGGEFMEQAKIDRIKKIAARRWRRTLSNRIGVSHEEKARLDRLPEPPLPIEEPLLADRDDHIVEHSERELSATDHRFGFKLTIPKYKYNRGEVYNLCIARGTLTEEERYRINDHIVQTIVMLESLPFPKHLRNVPELAGGHHEKMDGTGYPKGLRGDQMSPVARMMAIADVFEALTAADRPYKKAKKLSEAVAILGLMKKNHHLDPDLVDLFLTSYIWRDYAEIFLHPDQIDEPDLISVLEIRPAA
ncbi:MAG: HD domain-containing phosphohydrolase [Dongiaceae bacterium]